jgi:hypothetical protein
MNKSIKWAESPLGIPVQNGGENKKASSSCDLKEIGICISRDHVSYTRGFPDRRCVILSPIPFDGSERGFSGVSSFTLIA